MLTAKVPTPHSSSERVDVPQSGARGFTLFVVRLNSLSRYTWDVSPAGSRVSVIMPMVLPGSEIAPAGLMLYVMPSSPSVSWVSV
jgi:hypothetical protein